MRSLFVLLVMWVVTWIFAPTVMVARLLGVPQGPDSIYARAIRRW